MSHELILDALEWEVLKGPVSSKIWIQLIKLVTAETYPDPCAKANAINMAYERAVRALPHSYKLWFSYLRYRREETKSLCTPNEWFQSIRELFERALEKLPLMPMLWVSYLEFVISFPFLRIVMVRHIIGRSLCTLPVTQHHHIWKIAKVWSAHSGVPTQTFKAIWSVYLQFDSSKKNQSQYFSLLFHRGNNEDFLEECVRAIVEGHVDLEMPKIDRSVFDDPSFWEPIAMIFQSVGWRYAGEIKQLDQLVDHGLKHCASPHYFLLSYAMFLYGQGLITQGREAFIKLLSESPSHVELRETYRIALEIEDQLVESFALNEELRGMNAAQQESVARAIFRDASPLDYLRYLVREYPMWLNQVQIRCSPICVPLWLKRVELLQESAVSSSDVESLFRQAITRCTSGMRDVDAMVGELYQSYARYLLSQGKWEMASQVLQEGAWDIPFSATAINTDLLRFYAEIQIKRCCSSSAKTVVSKILPTLLAYPPRTRPQHRMRLAKPAVEVGTLRVDYRSWLLLVDLCAMSNDLDTLHSVIPSYVSSEAFTTEACAYVAHTFWKLGDSDEAARVLEVGLTNCRVDDALSIFFLVDQYISLLITESRRSDAKIPMHHIRELFRLAEEAMPVALPLAPAATLNFFLTCAWLEAKEGLYGNAVQMLQRAAQLSLSLLPAEPNRILMICILERSIDCTFMFKGLYTTRDYCRKLLVTLEDAELVQRVVLHWAALERRCGELETAHVILDASCRSQDPSSSHGATYWQLWQSMCTNVSEYEKVKRRCEQVTVEYTKASATS